MQPPQVKLVYTIDDFPNLGFHDCRIYGIRWGGPDNSLVFDLDYIVKWVEVDGHFQFRVAPAELRFDWPSEVRFDLEWGRDSVQFQIFEIRRRDAEPTPNGTAEYRWEIEFAIPWEGSIELLSTNFQLSLLSDPVLCEQQWLRG